MSYSCPDCKDGTLIAKVRDIPIGADETAEIVDGLVRITSVGCDNGCSSEVEDEEEEEKPKRKKKAPAAIKESIHETTADCDRPTGHTGRCNHNGKGS